MRPARGGAGHRESRRRRSARSSARVVAEEASDAGPGVVEFSRLDITDGDATESLFRSAARELGGIDVLVNIAGLQRSAMAEEITDDLFESIYRVNVLGTIHTQPIRVPDHAVGRHGGDHQLRVDVRIYRGIGQRNLRLVQGCRAYVDQDCRP
ncbi:SDR family NAD(P)-dependent oxidoreductase [Rhodococcus jostii]|uniref:SDR family NAD(P)-dependent oxidoreductase n=1 Tax=Rhodococcus jostii TaxID=132919 RepID=UPI003664CB3A